MNHRNRPRRRNTLRPQMYYLRKLTLGRQGDQLTLYVFWNYRNTVKGSVKTDSRTTAKRVIRKANPEAVFFR